MNNEKQIKEYIENRYKAWVLAQDNYTRKKVKKGGLSFNYGAEKTFEEFSAVLEKVPDLSEYKNESIEKNIHAWADKAIGDFGGHLTSKDYLGYDVDDI